MFKNQNSNTGNYSGAIVGGTASGQVTLGQNKLSYGQILSSGKSLSLNWDSGVREEQVNTNMKSYQVFEINEDLLALSVAWHRIRKSSIDYVPIESLTANILFEKVNDDDRNLAKDIKKYYSQKIMVLKLKNNKLSKFRDDLNNFVHQNTNVYKKEVFPLVYRLPEFYNYDIAFDKFKTTYNTKIKNDNHEMVSVCKTLKFVGQFIVGKGSSKRIEFWFVDEHNNLVNFNVMKDNPLMSLLDNTIKSEFKLHARFVNKSRDDVEYLVPNKYRFL